MFMWGEPDPRDRASDSVAGVKEAGIHTRKTALGYYDPWPGSWNKAGVYGGVARPEVVRGPRSPEVLRVSAGGAWPRRRQALDWALV